MVVVISVVGEGTVVVVSDSCVDVVGTTATGLFTNEVVEALAQSTWRARIAHIRHNKVTAEI